MGTAALPEGEPLPEALERAVRLLTAGVRTLAVQVRVVGRQRPLPASVEPELLRIAQEAVANLVKHSGARRGEVRLEYAAGRAVTLRVTDDGQGFDPAAVRGAADRETRFGLAGMGERAARLGARLSVQSAPGKGTRVTVRVVPACP
jgi:signal transduction histidine kinase